MAILYHINDIGGTCMSRFELYRYDEENIIKRKEYTEQEELLAEIQKLKNALRAAYQNYDFITEPELVDAHIYELKSIQMKYSFLLHRAKELGIYSEKISYIV